jgi:glycosyltransferase involved in cell wall biosynthesis
MALYAYFFCNDKNYLGQWNGYPLQKFYRYFDILSGVIADSHFLAEDLRERHVVPPNQKARIVTLETPVPVPPAAVTAPPPLAGRRPQIFWAGRFDRQKRVDIVLALAMRLPEADFRLWGEPVLDANVAMSAKPANVSLEGVYGDLGELPFENCDLWLYTSEWDGVPNILIEVAARGVPLVGSLAGGTGEILQEGLSWSVTDIEDIGAYEAGVRVVLADPGGARERAGLLRDRVLSRRTPLAYRNTLETLLSGRASA